MVRRVKTSRDIIMQAERLRSAAEKKYGTRFTKRNLRIIDAYNSVMNKHIRSQVSVNKARGAVSG